MPRQPNTPRQSKSKRAKSAEEVQPSKQQLLEGTEHKVSKKLRDMYQELEVAKYRAKAENDNVKALGPQVAELMRDEGVTELSTEIEYGGEMRTVITNLTEKLQLSSKLVPLDDAA